MFRSFSSHPPPLGIATTNESQKGLFCERSVLIGTLYVYKLSLFLECFEGTLTDVLQMIATPEDNTVFSPYGLMSMALLVYEGATGQTAAQLYSSLHLPWHRDIVRVGFRDLHRYLRVWTTHSYSLFIIINKA